MTKSDLIRRADVVRLLVERYKFTTSEATEILSQLPSAEAEWIPVSEKPKENGEYIASLEGSVYPQASFFNGKWFMRSLNGIAREFGEYEVIAWKPMPELYREDGE